MDIYETRRRNLRALIDARFGGRIARLADAIDRAPSYVSRCLSESGDHKKRIGEQFARDIELTVGIPLLTLDREPRSESEHANVIPVVHPHRKPREYPLISWIAAGERAESPDNYLPGDCEEMIESTENAGERGYWLTVKGLSMKSEGSPSFPPGIRILVRPEGYDVISGKFYIAKHRDGETTFKQYSRDAGSEYLVPLNPAFSTVKMDDDWHIIGRVIDAKIPGL